MNIVVRRQSYHASNILLLQEDSYASPPCYAMYHW